MLTDTQLQQLVTALRASGDTTVIAALAIGNVDALAAWCNAPSSTLAWRNAMTGQEVDEITPWTAFDGLSAGRRDSWRQFLTFPRDFGRPRIRQWVTDVWGAATASSSSEAILQAGRESATNAQALLGGTTRTTGTVSALNRAYAGEVAVPQLASGLNRF
jgi:hypothetical protein